jgi:EpsI family protein
MTSARLWVVALLMSAAALLLHVRGDSDRVPPSRPLNELPMTIGARTATDYVIDAGQLEILGKGYFLNRIYNAELNGRPVNSGELAPVGLYIGYFPTQRTGQSIHSPQNCLPGAGWTFQAEGVTDLTSPTGKKYSVGEYLITNGNSTQEVLYWYQMQGRTIANDYKAKLYTLAESIRYSRTDAALVRVMTQVNPGEDQIDAHRRAVAFADQIVPLLPAYIPD